MIAESGFELIYNVNIVVVMARKAQSVQCCCFFSQNRKILPFSPRNSSILHHLIKVDTLFSISVTTVFQNIFQCDISVFNHALYFLKFETLIKSLNCLVIHSFRFATRDG